MQLLENLETMSTPWELDCVFKLEHAFTNSFGLLTEANCSTLRFAQRILQPEHLPKHSPRGHLKQSWRFSTAPSPVVYVRINILCVAFFTSDGTRPAAKAERTPL